MRHSSVARLLLGAALWGGGSGLALGQDATSAGAPPGASSAPPEGEARPGAALQTPEAAGTAAGEVGNDLNDIVVTAVGTPRSKLRTSVSVSTLDPDAIQQSAPSSVADILRNVPGIRSEASGGEGNANVSVRGLPLASGGAKYVQFQEDGLPVLEFGDIDFATPDTFLRFDGNVARLEVVRGGSASTFTSNAPGGVFNFISKTGETPGGSFGVTAGLNYDEQRYDFDYGGPIAPGWRFHVGGFYRNGDGPREAEFTTENGGQIKGNVTHDLGDAGFIRFDFKYLNDRSPAYLPIPVSLTGGSSNPNVGSLGGFNATYGTLLSQYFRNDRYYDHLGRANDANTADGYDVQSGAVGFELKYDLYEGLTVDDKFRVAFNSGGFLGVYPASINPASATAASAGGPGATFRYATGPAAGLPYLAANQVVTDTLFNTTLNNLGNVINDFKLSKTVGLDGYGSVDLAAGFYHSTQNLVEDWHWNQYFEQAVGKNAPLLNLVNAAGQVLTLNGQNGYNQGFGNVVRYYDLSYDTDAPYLSAAWQYGRLNLDASFRYDFASGSGSYSAAPNALLPLATGNPAFPTLQGYLVSPSTRLPVNYTKGYLSYSFGANYLLADDLGSFARISQGGRANAERILFGQLASNGDAPDPVIVDTVRQIEGGLKWNNRNFTVFGTGFYAHTQETNYDITQINPLIEATYEAEGLELETDFHYGNFLLAAGATYTHSQIVKDQAQPGNVGHTPQRQADFVYQITPGYYAEAFNAGLNIIGTTDSYASDANNFVQPGYTTVNAFANWYVRPDLQLSLAVNNLFDVIGITEIDALPNAQGAALARTINGRTVKAGLRYTF